MQFCVVEWSSFAMLMMKKNRLLMMKAEVGGKGAIYTRKKPLMTRRLWRINKQEPIANESAPLGVPFVRCRESGSMLVGGRGNGQCVMVNGPKIVINVIAHRWRVQVGRARHGNVRQK